jgi:hypothetical protein
MRYSRLDSAGEECPAYVRITQGRSGSAAEGKGTATSGLGLDVESIDARVDAVYPSSEVIAVAPQRCSPPIIRFSTGGALRQRFWPLVPR